MANPKDMGFLTSLGLGPVNESAVLQQQAQSMAPQGSGNVAAFAQIGAGAGGLIAPGLAGVGGLLTGKGFQQGMQDAKDSKIAQGLGIDVPTLRSQRAIRTKVQALKTDTSKSHLDQQIDLTRQTIAIANSEGNSEVALNALRQLTNLRAQKIEFEKAGLALEGQQTGNEQSTQNLAQDIYDGVTVFPLNGDEDSKPGSGLLVTPAMAANGQEDPANVGKYKVMWPGEKDPQYLERPEFLMASTSGKHPSAKTSQPRVADSLRAVAAHEVGGTRELGKRREALEAMREAAYIADNVGDLLVSMSNPGAALSASASVRIGAQEVIQFATSTQRTLSGDGRKLNEGKWNGKPVSAQKEYELFHDGVVQELESLGESAFPEHLREELAADAVKAQQWRAMTAQLEYLDAKLVEPSNRGLSDNDIKNAGKRVGSNTADPTAFLTRQIQVIDDSLFKLDHLGDTLPEVSGNFTRQDIANHIWPESAVNSIKESLLGYQTKMKEGIAKIQSGETGLDPNDATDIRNLSLEELEALAGQQ